MEFLLECSLEGNRKLVRGAENVERCPSCERDVLNAWKWLKEDAEFVVFAYLCCEWLIGKADQPHLGNVVGALRVEVREWFVGGRKNELEGLV